VRRAKPCSGVAAGALAQYNAWILSREVLPQRRLPRYPRADLVERIVSGVRGPGSRCGLPGGIGCRSSAPPHD
jgi:hypothetical protein